MKQPLASTSSQNARIAAMLLAQVADLERGERIKALREARHLTQPAVADALPVSLRAYQAWEAGGGITWEHTKLLAKVLDADPDFIMSGPRGETPELAKLTQLDRIEAKLDVLLEAQFSPGEEFERALGIDDQTPSPAQRQLEPAAPAKPKRAATGRRTR